MSAIALYARPTPGFDERVAHALAMLRSAATDHAGAIVQATSLGAELLTQRQAAADQFAGQGI